MSPSPVQAPRISVDPHPAEEPLYVVVLVIAASVWIMLAVTVIGLVYALALGLFFFISHMAFVAHIRGSGVKLGPDQFPDLHARVVELSRAMGMEPPETYLVQAGGSLNALATRFLRSDVVVLFSDLLEACEDNGGARDMIIGHELAHLKCGHLRWTWFLLPGYFMPFLGSALSRAREYTCDRYGVAAAGNASDAALGLTILAAGAKFAPMVNRAGFVRQRHDMNTGFMTLAEWFGSHPPLVKRIAAVDQTLRDPAYRPARGRTRALALIGGVATVTTAGMVAAAFVGGALLQQLAEIEGVAEASEIVDPEIATAQVAADFDALEAFLTEHWTEAAPPASWTEVRERWEALDPATSFPHDPFDGYDYGFYLPDTGWELLSSGPDGEAGTDDDIVRTGGFPAPS